MLDGTEGAGAQEEAAAALAKLAQDSLDNRISIVDAGGIRPLLSLLESPSAKAKENVRARAHERMKSGRMRPRTQSCLASHSHLAAKLFT